MALAPMPPPLPPDLARRYFHWGLLDIFLMGLAAPLLWIGVGVVGRSGERGIWPRLLLTLAVLDSAMLVTVVLLMSGTLADPTETGDAEVRLAPRIGLQMNPDDEEGRVEAVIPDSPAARAGVLVGDRIVAVDGKPFAGIVELGTAVEEAGEEIPWDLEILRDGERLRIELVAELMPVPERPLSLFATRAADEVDLLPGARDLLPLLPFVLLFSAVLRRSMRRAPRPQVFTLFFGGALLAPFVVPIVVQGILVANLDAIPLVFFFLTGYLTDAIVAGIALVGIVVLARHLRDEAVPRLSRLYVTVVGVVYAYAIGTRVGIVVTLLEAALDAVSVHVPSQSTSEIWAPGPMTGSAKLLLAGFIVIAGPICEEILFRGLLLPWLVKWMKPITAVVISAALFGLLHHEYGVGVLVPFMLGIIFGWARLRTGGLVAPIVIHMVFNLIAAIMIFTD